MSHKVIPINRARPDLWAAIVAERLGFSEDERCRWGRPWPGRTLKQRTASRHLQAARGEAHKARQRPTANGSRLSCSAGRFLPSVRKMASAP